VAVLTGDGDVGVIVGERGGVSTACGGGVASLLRGEEVLVSQASIAAASRPARRTIESVLRLLIRSSASLLGMRRYSSG
jgi:hypothetical protein